MQINPDLQSRLASPFDTLVQVVLCSHDIRVARILLKGPVSDWDADGIETSGGDLLEVGQRHPALPMLSQDVGGVGDLLGQGILIDDGAVLSLED